MVLISWLLPGAWMSAQEPKGALTGVVLTAMEAALPDAVVTLTDTKTGTSQTSTSGKSGDYGFATVAPGLYDFTVSAPGYRPFVRHRIQVGETAVRMDARLQREKDENLGSLKDLEAAVANKPDDALARFTLARAYLATGEAEKGRLQLEHALEARPDFLPARLALVQLAMRRGDVRTALSYAQELRRLNPDSSVGMLLEATSYLRMGMFEESRQLLDNILKTNPNDTEALLELGVLNLARKQYSEAEPPFRRAYVLDPSNLRGLEGVTEIRFMMQQPEKAVDAVAAEVASEPQRRDLRRELALVEVRARQYDKAIGDFQAVLDQFKNSPAEQAEILTRIGETYGLTGDYARAIDSLKKANQLGPDNVVSQTILASLYERAGKKQEALAAYQAALKLDPNNAAALNNAAFLMADTGGDLEEALRMVQKARQQMPGSNEVLDTVGFIYLKKNLTDSAVRVFQDLVQRFNMSATYHYHLALALAQKGDRAGALAQLDLALQCKPGKEEEGRIREMIRKLS
jgi:tetratricopeptide (TPR) repeat protein